MAQDMRLTGLVASAALGLAMMAGVAMAQSYEVKQTSDGYLNLWSGPGTSNAILQRLYPGMTVQYLEERGNWTRIHGQRSPIGWVYSRYPGD